MKFTFDAYNRGGFGINIEGSGTPVNYEHMDEEKFGKYEIGKEEVFESLPAVKRAVREYIKTERLSADDRSYKNYELREITLEDLVDELMNEIDHQTQKAEKLELEIERIKHA